MGCAQGREGDPELARRNKEVERILDRDGKKFRNEVKLLLLGPGESGKSTIFKQMKLIHDGEGFDDEELANWKYIVWGNVISQMQVLCEAAEDIGIQLETTETQQLAEDLLMLSPTGDSWSTEVADNIKKLWMDKGIKACFSEKDKRFQLNDSAEYFFQNIDRFKAANYLPSTDDVIRARVKTTGIEEAPFQFDDMIFRMVDVGGQRSERRKWIHCFDCVTAVVFCASMSGYDQVLREDNTQNRMKEALLLFDEVVNSPWFRDTSFILFLNKRDLFEEKIKKVDLTCCFPNYGGGHDYDAAAAYIRERFLEVNRSPAHTIFSHYAVAIDTNNVKTIWMAVRETILRQVFDEIF